MALPPGGRLEICFSFDTTISMTKYVDQVKARLQDMVQKLQADIPHIRIALMAHGDFYQSEYDNKAPYVLRHIDFTDDVTELCKFIQSADPTAGGDWEECYEYVLQQAGEVLSWSEGTNKVFVLIGDAVPHELDDPVNEKKIDWKAEVEALRKKGVKLYGSYCKTPNSTKADVKFFKDLSTRGEGSYLLLENFSSIFDFLMAICYREHGEDALHGYESEVRGRGEKAPKDVNDMFKTLKKSASNASSVGEKLGLKTSASLTSNPSTKSRPAAAISKKAKASMAKTAKKPTPSKAAKGKNPKATTAKAIHASKPAAQNQRTRKIQPSKKTPFTEKRLRRERVPQTNFLLREFSWSPWKLAYCGNNLGNGWEKRTKGHVGYQKQTLFRDRTAKRSIYEFAVQLKCGKRLIVVFRNTGFCPCPSDGKFLDSQLDKVLKSGCSVFVRRLVLKHFKRYERAEDSLMLYDYVWRSDAADGENTRDLVRDDIVISERMETD